VTFAVILIAIIGGWLWLGATGSPVIVGPVTVYVFAFAAGLASAVLFALRSGNRRLVLGAGVLVLNFIGSHIAWRSGDPILFTAILDFGTAAWFVLVGLQRWEIAIGGLYLTSVMVAFLTAVDVIPSHLERAQLYLAFSFPDLTAAIGHIANATVGFASGDTGFRLRERLGAPSRLASLRQRALGVLRQRSGA
jgi:hypothetical protein